MRREFIFLLILTDTRKEFVWNCSPIVSERETERK